ncbi:MAG: helix-hairpin-helix domain-containing protein [Thermoleophilia bacterium]|nr:helix-hairpin-helix domain-containing protein [Thermoleophilia bacterium]
MTAAAPKRASTRDVGPTRGVGQTSDDPDALAALQTLPSIGPRLAEKLLLLGVRSPAGLRGRDPEALYDELQAQLGPVDRCVLYAFRCAVYAAEHAAADGGDQSSESGAADPELARWWNWKDGGPALRRAQAAAGSRRNSIASR